MNEWWPGVPVVGRYQTLHGKCDSLKLDQKVKLIGWTWNGKDEKVKLEGEAKTTILNEFNLRCEGLNIHSVSIYF